GRSSVGGCDVIVDCDGAAGRVPADLHAPRVAVHGDRAVDVVDPTGRAVWAAPDEDESFAARHLDGALHGLAVAEGEGGGGGRGDGAGDGRVDDRERSAGGHGDRAVLVGVVQARGRARCAEGEV